MILHEVSKETIRLIGTGEYIAFYSAFLNIHISGVLTALVWLVPHETAAVSARSVYTIQPCTMSFHANFKPHNYVRCMRV